MLRRKPKSRISAALGAALLTPLLFAPAFCANPPKFSGSLAGIVRDAAGIPQMGATVLLFNRYEKLLQRALTNERGAFGFESLSPDLYSVRVSLASFAPMIRHRIAVQPGIQSLLYINMSNLLGSIELVYAAPGQGALMSDDWKWTLKTATATRPILRFGPDTGPQIAGMSESPDPQHSGSIFSDTRGMLNLSGGDAVTLASSGDVQDLGTAFAVATSLFGRNQLEVSGNVGYAMHSGAPMAGFRTVYSREGMTPEISVTMRQVSLPTRAGTPGVAQDGVPMLRSMSVGLFDHTNLTDDLRLEYGVSLDSISFVEHSNYYSPFARFTYDLGKLGSVQLAYSSGAPPTALSSHPAAAIPGEAIAGDPGTRAADALSLSNSLAELALLPRVSLLDGQPKVERTQDIEIGYEKSAGSRTFNLSGFREIVSNGALTVMAPGDLFAAGDVLPDISSDSGILNIGNYQRYGYAASVTQALGDRLEVSASAGRAGAFTASDSTIDVASADEVRSRLRNEQRFWGSARASATLPGASTQITASYEWTDYSALMPMHYYLTQKAYPEPGLNIHIRQPLPCWGSLPGHLEATVDLRNMMAQGYLPLSVAARRVLLMQNPRAFRGGLSFIF